MISDAERMFWENKAEKLRGGYLAKLGIPENYEKHCDIVVKRMDGGLILVKKITNGKIYYQWRKQIIN